MKRTYCDSCGNEMHPEKAHLSAGNAGINKILIPSAFRNDHDIRFDICYTCLHRSLNEYLYPVVHSI